MTEPATSLVVAVIAVPLVSAGLAALMPSLRAAHRLSIATASITASLALALAIIAFVAAPDVAAQERWYVLDVAGGVFLCLIGIVGLASAITSSAYLRHAERGSISARRSRTLYYGAFNLFWAALLAVPLADNLGIAWLLVEATTAASAVLVAFSGKRSALEAGWKYVVLTTLGLTVALLGIVTLLAAGGEAPLLGDLDWRSLAVAADGFDREVTLVAFVLIVVGFASKIGWAPVHNWLPDAHSESPAPISAMLSAALLPTVLLVVWRTKLALEPALGEQTAQVLLVGFGLASLAVAVPFLWQTLALKRLLAYSSLEHMGVLALGIGFGTPLAIAGVVVHLGAHGLAKALGFYTSIPLLREDPECATAAPRGILRTSPATGFSVGVSLAALAGLPPLPMFISEVMILLGGIQAGLLGVSAAGALLLALGFLGIAHALLEGLLGERRGGGQSSRTARPVAILAGAVAIAMLALSAAAFSLPGSKIVDGLMGTVT